MFIAFAFLGESAIHITQEPVSNRQNCKPDCMVMTYRTLLFRQCVSGLSRYFSHSKGRIHIFNVHSWIFDYWFVFFDLFLSCFILYIRLLFFLTASTIVMIRKEVL